MLCDRCDKEIGQTGEYPMLALKTLGLYETAYQSIAMLKSTLTVTGNVTNAEIGVVDVTAAGVPNIFPRHLHRLPGRPVNVYPMLNEPGLRMRLVAGTVATPAVINAAFKWRDLSDYEYLLGILSNLSLAAVTSEVGFFSPCSPIIGSQVQGELPAKLGSFVLEGTIALGTATSVALDCYINFGLAYGTAK